MLLPQLRKKRLRLQRLAQQQRLLLDHRKVARREHVERGQNLAPHGLERIRIATQCLGNEHLLALGPHQWPEADLECKAPQRSLIQPIEQVGRADEDAVKALHALQHLVDFRHLVVAHRTLAALHEAVSLVEQQERALFFSAREHGGNLLLRLAHVLAHQV